ncbi:MAG: helix-turn-helix transcriptional regulator [Symbiobacteriia bacterium]
MATLRSRAGSEDRLGTSLKALEDRLYVRRQEEVALFLRYLLDSTQPEHVLNVFGPGGVGKSVLLSQYQRAATRAGAAYLGFDCRDISAAPEALTGRILDAFDRAHPEQHLVLALDTYEEAGSADRWLRDVLLPRLPDRALIVIAGRQPLQGVWHASPARRQLVKLVPLRDFSRAVTREYLDRCGLRDSRVAQQVWSFTQGHPLALSLATPLAQRGVSLGSNVPEQAETILELTRCWMREVADDSLRGLVEAAAAVRFFDAESLSFIMGEGVPRRDFDRLTTLSFVRLGESGWALHDLVRTVISRELRWRAPEQSRLFRERALSWYRGKITSVARDEDRARALIEFLFLLDNPLIRALDFADSASEGFQITPATAADVPELMARFDSYLGELRARPRDIRWEFPDSASDFEFILVMPAKQFLADSALLHLGKLLELEPSFARLCRDANGALRGFTVVMPVRRDTYAFLAREPVSGPYFQSLSRAERAAYLKPPARTKGAPVALFFRYIATFDASGSRVAGALFRDLFVFLLRQTPMILSSSIPAFLQAMRQLGLQEIPEAAHYDLGPDIPSQVLALDPSGPRLLAYLDWLAKGANLEAAVYPGSDFGLTARESEVVQMVVTGLTNAQVATKLVVSEVTVKKHLTHIFAKTGVSNRTQLVRKLLSDAAG